jgi:mycothiol synthase
MCLEAYTKTYSKFASRSLKKLYFPGFIGIIVVQVKWFTLPESQMENRPFANETDLQKMRDLMASLPQGASVVDFEEHLQLSSVRENTRLWMDNGQLTAFAFVDDFDNLWLEISLAESTNLILEREIVTWAAECIRLRNSSTGDDATLDASCAGSQYERIALLERNGFIRSLDRSLHYRRALLKPIPFQPLPDGYHIRVTQPERELDALVTLHRAAFESNQMTVEYRQAIMAGAQYAADLDWVMVAPNGGLVAFCLGSVDLADCTVGFLDPVGVHPDHQGKGLGAALMTHGLQELKERGVTTAALGTSSENIGMQKLAEKMGFVILS